MSNWSENTADPITDIGRAIEITKNNTGLNCRHDYDLKQFTDKFNGTVYFTVCCICNTVLSIIENLEDYPPTTIIVKHVVCGE